MREMNEDMDTPEGRADSMEKVRELVNSSPYYRHVQMQVIGFTQHGCIMIMKSEDQHTNLYGNTHGGAIASLADSACGISLTVALHRDEYAMTQHLDVSYLKPAAKGLLRAEGRILSGAGIPPFWRRIFSMNRVRRWPMPILSIASGKGRVDIWGRVPLTKIDTQRAFAPARVDEKDECPQMHHRDHRRSIHFFYPKG